MEIAKFIMVKLVLKLSSFQLYDTEYHEATPAMSELSGEKHVNIRLQRNAHTIEIPKSGILMMKFKKKIIIPL